MPLKVSMSKSHSNEFDISSSSVTLSHSNAGLLTSVS